MELGRVDVFFQYSDAYRLEGRGQVYLQDVWPLHYVLDFTWSIK